MLGKPMHELKSIDKSLKYRSVTDYAWNCPTKGGNCQTFQALWRERERLGTHTLVNLLAIMFRNLLIQWICAFDHAGMKVVVRNYEISDLKIRLGRFLFSHKEIKEWLKLQKCPAILPGNLACLHVHGTLRYSTGAELWHYWTTCF